MEGNSGAIIGLLVDLTWYELMEDQMLEQILSTLPRLKS
jgi:hypothetical protein